MKAESQKNRYVFNADDYSRIPGCPIAYWVTKSFLNVFASPKLGQLCQSKTGITTGDNNRFLRLWYEVISEQISSKWFFYNKGGGYRKWYGNIEYIIDWEDDGRAVKAAGISTIRNPSYYFRKCISWNLITTDRMSVRDLQPIFVMGDAGPACYFDEDRFQKITLGLLNSTVGVMEVFPIIPVPSKNRLSIVQMVDECVDICKIDWDISETSWEFKKHPLL